MDKVKFFKAGDYIHLGLAILMTGLGIWGAIATPIVIAKVLSAVLSVAATASFVVLAVAFRLPQWKAYHAFVDIEGAFKFRWKAEAESRRLLTPGLLKQWSTELMDVLTTNPKYGLSLAEAKTAMNGTEITFLDTEFIEYDVNGATYKASGLTWGPQKVIKIASVPKDEKMPLLSRMRSLFRHEGGHVFVFHGLKVPGNADSHAILTEMKL